MTEIHTVRLEPVGVEFEVAEDETILDAAFRQGIALPHGCKEGQCSACKCIQLDGETEMLKYSTFALNDMDKDSGHILMCRTLAYSDVEIELLNFDEEVLSKSIPVKEFSGRIVDFQKLTHDIRGVQIELDAPLKFWAGQYVDITVKTETGRRLHARSPWQIRRAKPKGSASSSRNTPTDDSRTNSTTAASRPGPKSGSRAPTECASDAKPEQDR